MNVPEPTLTELIRRAKACRHCGKEHKLRKLTGPDSIIRDSWADPIDGHPYSTAHYGKVARWLEAQQ